MANLTPSSSWSNTIQLETTDPVLGGSGGEANLPHQDLLDRTEYLKETLKNSLKYEKKSFSANWTGGNANRKVLTINNVSNNVTNFNIIFNLSHTTSKSCFLHLNISIFGIESITRRAKSYIKLIEQAVNNFSGDIYVIVEYDSVSDSISINLESESSWSYVDVILLNKYEETADFGGFQIENGLLDFTWESDILTTSIKSSTLDNQMTLFFADDIRYLELQSNLVPTSAPIDSNNLLIERTVSNIPDYFPIGSVIMWYGTAANIPNKWQQCDGTNGTPNMEDKFPIGKIADGDIGSGFGSNTQSVSFTTNVDGSHSHSGLTSIQTGGSSGYSSRYDNSDGATASRPDHTHGVTISSSGSHQHSGTSNSFDNKPASIGFYYIMKITQ